MKPWITAAAVILILATLGLSAFASAHALLVSANPGPNAILAKAPLVVQLSFSENLDPVYSRIQVFNSSRVQVDNQDSRVSPTDPKVMQVSLLPLPNGSYSVVWRSLSAIDGHATSGSYVFTVGNGGPGGPCLTCGSTNLPPSPLEIAARWGAYLSLAMVAGGFGFLLLVWLPAASTLDLPARRSKSSPSFLDIPSRSAAIAVGASLGLLASLFALLVIFSTNASPDLPLGAGLPAALSASFGRDLLARLGTATGLLLMALGLRRVARGPRAAEAPRGVPAANGGKVKRNPLFTGILQGFRRPAQQDLRPLWFVALGGFGLSLVSAATFSISSHGASTIPPLGTAMDFIHLASLSLWIGGLFHVTLAAMPKLVKSTSPRAGEVSAEVAGNFSALATLMVGGMFLSGGYLVLETVGSIDALIGTLYGQTVLVKVALFIPLLAVGTYNHFRLRPSLAYTRELEDDSIVHRRRFLRTTRMEALLGAGILVAAGLLTALTPAAYFAGAQHPPTYTAERVVDGVDIQFDITPYPSRPGSYTFTVFLLDASGNAYSAATAVILVMTDAAGNSAPITLNLTSIHGFHYESQAAAFPVQGTWNIAMTIKRSNGPDITTTFTLGVT